MKEGVIRRPRKGERERSTVQVIRELGWERGIYLEVVQTALDPHQER